MHAKWLVSFKGGNSDYDIEKDLELSSSDANAWRNHLNKEFKEHFLKSKSKYGYIVVDHKSIRSVGNRFVISDDPKKLFYKSYIIRENPDLKPQSSHIKIRRLELVGGKFYCTDAYIKTLAEVRHGWKTLGIKALNP